MEKMIEDRIDFEFEDRKLNTNKRGSIMQELKTLTLTDEGGDNPTAVICDGHVTAAEFNKAFKAEDWSNEGDYTEETLKHIYGKDNGNKGWAFSDKEKKGYKPVTFTHWD